MTSLCSDKPKINPFNKKNSPKFDSEINENSILTHNNFNLIITFNLKYSKNTQGLVPVLENKCLYFHLLQIVYKNESSTQLLYSGLINSGMNHDMSYQLAGKITKIHIMAKNKSIENKEFIERDAVFTSRAINRLIKYISTKYKEDPSKISTIIKVGGDKFYARPYIEEGYYTHGGKGKS